MSSNKHVIVGMSGGVDSSVAALLLLQQGYRVEGLFMKNWEEDDAEDDCTAKEDLADAQAVCDRLDIPLHKVNFSDQYWDRVFQYFLDEYDAGRTPNPDILCNKEIKFRAFLEHALNLGADFIATGHYVRKRLQQEHWQLLRGLDSNKDQSYFLYTLNQHQLAHALFPLGELEKPRVRELAHEHGLITHDKKDSTGICFIGERKFREFLQKFLPARPGDVVTDDGRVIGQHQGLMYVTLGQRKGLGIGGVKGADEAPWYSVAKDLANNRLIVGQGENHPLLFHSHCQASRLHWVSGEAPAAGFTCQAKIRYRQPDQDCIITSIDDDQCVILFPQSQRAITPGQSIVFYADEVCLGGGIIDSMWNGAAT